MKYYRAEIMVRTMRNSYPHLSDVAAFTMEHERLVERMVGLLLGDREENYPDYKIKETRPEAMYLVGDTGKLYGLQSILQIEESITASHDGRQQG